MGDAFVFDRYVNGVLMAEGVTIERARSVEDAMRVAAELASRGPNGEAPVLVLAASSAPSLPEDVERVVRFDHGRYGMRELPNGGYVLFSDYRALSSQLTEARAELDALRGREDDVREEMYERGKAVGMAEHKAERDRLAAKVAVAKEALSVADQFFAGITPDANTQSSEEMDETRSAIAEAVRAALASLEDRA